jgi:hypothetical protein
MIMHGPVTARLRLLVAVGNYADRKAGAGEIQDQVVCAFPSRSKDGARTGMDG